LCGCGGFFSLLLLLAAPNRRRVSGISQSGQWNRGSKTSSVLFTLPVPFGGFFFCFIFGHLFYQVLFLILLLNECFPSLPESFSPQQYNADLITLAGCSLW
jgi:hypothetical protein